ncbi:MAG: IclR family transcriptional regulator [Halothermotrichaceae bacterium]
MARKKTVKSVIKTFRILDLLVQNDSPMSFSSISNIVNINISTVHRLLNTMVKIGYVKQNDANLYCLGINSYQMADIVYHKFDLKKIVHPYLQDIVSICNETCSLAVYNNGFVTYLDQVESSHTLRTITSNRTHAYCTSSGKILLAFMNNKKELDRYFSTTNFLEFSENTIIDPAILKKELETIKKQGYAVKLEENGKEIQGVAAPVFAKRKKLLGSIGISGPRSRLHLNYIEKELLPLILNKTQEISSYLAKQKLKTII